MYNLEILFTAYKKEETFKTMRLLFLTTDMNKMFNRFDEFCWFAAISGIENADIDELKDRLVNIEIIENLYRISNAPIYESLLQDIEDFKAAIKMHGINWED
jgi:hypothetical protein